MSNAAPAAPPVEHSTSAEFQLKDIQMATRVKSLETSSTPVPVMVQLDEDELEEAGFGDETPPPPPPSAAGTFHINLIFNASVNNAPAGFIQAVQNAASQVEALFSDSITLNITVGWGEIGGQAIT